MFREENNVGLKMGKKLAYNEYISCWDFDKTKARGKLP
jgi:nucleoside permease NupC